MNYYEPLLSGQEPLIPASDASKVKCSVHRESVATEVGGVGPDGRTVVHMFCDSCTSEGNEGALARYVLPTLLP